MDALQVAVLQREKRDSAARRSALCALQKMSLGGSPQIEMIERGVRTITAYLPCESVVYVFVLCFFR